MERQQRAHAENDHFVRQLIDVDELPAPLEPSWPCGAGGCDGHARVRGRYCLAHHALAMKRYRERHRAELLERQRAAAARRDPEAAARDSARAKVSMAVRRGKLVRGRCKGCWSKNVIAVIADPARPFDSLEWWCRADWRVEAARRRSERAREMAQQSYDQQRREALAGIAGLPPAIRAQLEAAAARGPAGITLSREAPLYTMQLVRAYHALHPDRRPTT